MDDTLLTGLTDTAAGPGLAKAPTGIGGLAAEAVRTFGIFWPLPNERPPDVVSPPD